MGGEHRRLILSGARAVLHHERAAVATAPVRPHAGEVQDEVALAVLGPVNKYVSK